jgi:hypothetical protein
MGMHMCLLRLATCGNAYQQQELVAAAPAAVGGSCSPVSGWRQLAHHQGGF